MTRRKFLWWDSGVSCALFCIAAISFAGLLVSLILKGRMSFAAQVQLALTGTLAASLYRARSMAHESD